MQNQIQKMNRGQGKGYSGRGIRTNTGKSEKAIAALQTRIDSESPELELINTEMAPSFASGHCILIWNNPAYGKLTLAEYVNPSQIAEVLNELPKWKYVAQSTAIAHEEWQRSQVLPVGSMVYWKYSYSNTFQYRDTKHDSLWKREERIGDDWRFVKALELPDFRGATSCDHRYYLRSGEEVLREDWNQNQEWFAAVRRWDLNNN